MKLWRGIKFVCECLAVWSWLIVIPLYVMSGGWDAVVYGVGSLAAIFAVICLVQP
jgi:hypothetical protein